MACSITKQKQIKEAARTEYSRLEDLLSQGYVADDLNGIPDIKAAMENMSAIESEKIEKVVDTGELISEEVILELNMNSPRVGGKPIHIVSGTRYADGKVTYNVKYPAGKTVYKNIGSGRLTASQVDPTELGRYGSEESVSVKISKDHEKLKSRLWEDQKAAIDLFDELAGLDSSLDSKHVAEMRDLLEKITDPQSKILNEFKVFINRKADRNSGAVVMYSGTANMVLNVAEGSASNGKMSAVEAYVHEMVHLSVEMARKYNKGPLSAIVGDLHALYEKAASEIKIDDLVVNGDRKEAEKLWNYMFNNENGLSEFIAYGMTNAKVKEELGKLRVKDTKTAVDESILTQIASKVIELWDAIRKLVSKDPNEEFADGRLAQLVADMWELNNRTVESNTFMSKVKAYAEKGRGFVDSNLVKAGSKAVDLLASGFDRTIEATKEVPVLGTTLRGTRTAIRWANPYSDEKQTAAVAQAARGLELAVDGWGLGWLFKQEGSTQMVMNYLREDDSATTRMEKLGLMSKNIDRHRESVIGQIGGELLKALKGTSVREQRALTEVILDLDMRVLFEAYTYDSIKKILADEKALKSIIEKESAKLKRLVDDEGIYNYYVSQSMGLGHYLATHEGGSSVNRSARHITDMKGTAYTQRVADNEKIKSNYKEIIKTIDRLATLEGISRSDKASVNAVSKLMDTHKNAIEKTVTYHNIHAVLLSDFKRANNVYVPTVKGEVKDLSVGWIEYKIAPDTESARAKMKKLGFKYKGDSSVKGMAVYTTMTSSMDKFEKGAAAKINADKEMHNLVGATTTVWEDKSMGLKSGAKQVELTAKAAKKEVAEQMKAIKMPNMDGFVPITHGEEIINYGISVNKDTYADIMKQDRSTPAVLAKMLGEIQEKKEATAMNRIVFKEILKDMKENYYYNRESEFGRKNHREYIEIGPDAENKGSVKIDYATRIWEDMPHNIRTEVMKLGKGKKLIAVRRDMAAMYFGRRAPSLFATKIPGLNKSVRTILSDNNLQYITEYIKLAGDIWMEMVRLLKIDVVIKTPKVLIDNIRSNLLLQSVLGQLPWEAVIGQIRMFKATKQYLKMEQKKLELESLIKSKNGTREDRAKLMRLKAMMKDSPVADTMAAGLFTGVVDEISLTGLQSKTRAEDVVERYTRWVPQVVKSFGNAVYINKDTWLFKALSMVLQYSDFVMRTSRYHYLLSTGVAKNVAIKAVLDEAVNYDRDLGGELAWAKSMGPWWFFNYFFGANKNMLAKMKDRPSAMILLEMSSMPNPTDATVWNKDFGYNMYGPLDLAYDKTVDYATNPALARLLGLTS